MSYIELPEGISDFDKAVISLWFRVPQASVDQLLADGGSSIPLMMFGKPQVGINYVGPLVDVSVWHFTPDGGTRPIFGRPVWTADGSDPVDPCYIRVNCFDASTLQLAFNIQMQDYAILTNAAIERSVVDVYEVPPGGIDVSPGSGYFLIPIAAYGHTTPADVSYIYNAAPEYFTVATNPHLEIDHWHHLLLSFDLTGTMSVGQPYPSSTCKLWYAIDDVDYRGPENLGPLRIPPFDGDPGDGLDPNAIVTGNIFNRSGGDPEPGLFDNIWIDAASGNYSPAPIPVEGAEFGIPALTSAVNQIYPVEMAELQFFTGVTLDTGEEDNRRAFITATTVDPDDSTIQIGGVPVPPIAPMIDNPDYDPSVPESAANPKQIPDPDGSPAEKLLGKKPDILLHGSGNWSIGKNTGPMIDNPDYDPALPTSADNPLLIPDPDFQFTPTGQIVSYTPDPSLHGPQSSTPTPSAVRLQRRIRVPA